MTDTSYNNGVREIG